MKIWCVLILGICILFCTLPSFPTGKKMYALNEGEENVLWQSWKVACYQYLILWLPLPAAGCLTLQSFTLSSHTTANICLSTQPEQTNNEAFAKIRYRACVCFGQLCILKKYKEKTKRHYVHLSYSVHFKAIKTINIERENVQIWFWLFTANQSVVS